MMWMFAESFTEEYEELVTLEKELAEEQAEKWAGYDEWLNTLSEDPMPAPEEEE